MSEHVSATPTRLLIRENQRLRGCFSWNKQSFLRLCAKLNETEMEVAARAFIYSRSVLERRFRDGFTGAEGGHLTAVNEAIDLIKTGMLR